jgi:hypothetical protein
MRKHGGGSKTSLSDVLKHGATVQLVHWERGRDGEWSSDLVTGLFLRMDAFDWQLVVGGHVRTYARDDWALCVA